MIHTLFNDSATHLRRKITGIGLLLIAFNIGAWAWAYYLFRDYPLLMGTAFLAYGFGLRHAVDADHIASIDNITRKLMQDGKKPISVGLFFSLGHSSIVALLSLLVAATTSTLQDRFGDLKAIGSIVGTSVSAFFLFTVAGINAVILMETWRKFQALRSGAPYDEEDLDLLLCGGGPLTRLFRGLYRLIGKSWHMYGLGLLFGLGFDTATEIGLLGLSASGASSGLSPWSIMVFPALFSAGMALIDTADGILMLGAYGWAFVKPVRKLYYNLTITSLSILVAVVVGGIETMSLIADKFELSGAVWRAVAQAGEHFNLLGYGIIGLFALGWAASVATYKLKRFDEIGATATSYKTEK